MKSDLEVADNIPDALITLPFDHYERYALTQRIVSLLWPGPGQRPIRILEVGGHSSALKHFLPDDSVVLADIEPPGTLTSLPFHHDGYFRASGTDLPFRDGSFDLVLALDTLEHVPAELRPVFLDELLRVSERAVILNGPTYHPRTAEAERRLARFLHRALSWESRFLQEHLALGLPKPEEIEAVLNAHQLPFLAIANGNLMLWLAMNALKNYVVAIPDGNRISEALDRAYNLLLSPRDFGGLTYRTAYVVAKDGDSAALERVRADLAPLLGGISVPEDFQPLEALMTVLEEHAIAFQENFSQLRNALADLTREVGQMRADVAARDARLKEMDAALLLKDAHIAKVETALHQANVHAAAAQHELDLIKGSAGYHALERLRALLRRLAPPGSRRSLPVVAAAKGVRLLFTEGPWALVKRAVPVWRWLPRLRRGAGAQASATLDDQYQLWLKANALTAARKRQIKRAAARLDYRPLVSIIMPIHNPEPDWLNDAIESVRGQLYDNWELCIADDASSRPGIRELLEERSRADARIKVTYLSKNLGIAGASNAALALAGGDFVGLLDHDDELKPDALFEVVSLLNADRDLDYIYSDEDKRDPDGRLVEPFFKPDWSPDFLMTVNYVTHFSVFRKTTLDRAGGFRSGYDGSQDYDLVLRVTEASDKIAHIAKPLYTWRKVPGSAAGSTRAKDYAYRAGKKALKDALTRRGLHGSVTDGIVEGRYRVKYNVIGDPKVAIIIPTRDRADLLRNCVDSIARKSSYRNYEVLVVDNGSKEQETLDYLSSFGGRVIKYPGEFNFAKINNLAAREANADFLLFLNNDIEVISAEWIEAMLEHAQRQDVAAVGARLLYPDGRVQHEGIIMGFGGGSAGNVDHGGCYGLGQSIRNCTAVTAACMMTSAAVFQKLGGFDESLRVAFNDVDFCLRARQQGYRIVYTPYASLYHHESASRGRLHPKEDEKLFRERWGNPGEYRDPYYNPNLDPYQPFTLRV